ncbi:LPS assembly lipoprotein LptE [uncultured Gilliamella sp.]|uniref:LPS assembly lipoprotein LptE n=1 Tax=uncultured Gilliamella sp. TaxID=1193505 RepID=UPI0025DFF5FE|nr:LPS assembly lipoprotein LptE [uncultured Gilliamella sp.]
MKKYLALLMLLTISLTGCGFHLQHEPEVPPQFKTMSYITSDPYGRLSRNIKEILRDNEVILVDNSASAHYPSLRVVSENLVRNTISLFQDGKAAEYQLVLAVRAQMVIAGQQVYPINVRIFRSFFNNPSAALAKTAEQNLIKDEMYKEAAKQIIRKLKSVNAVN